MKQRRPELPTIAVALLATWLVTGCTQWHYDLGRPISPETHPDPAQTTTLSRVLSDLGPPQRISAIANGYVLAWEFWRIKEEKIGLSLGLVGTDLLSVDWGQARIRGEFLLVTFDRQHRVTSSTYAHWDNSGGLIAAIHPRLFRLAAYLFGYRDNAPTRIVRVSLDRSVEVLFDDPGGELFSGASAAVMSEGVLVAGSIRDAGLLVCQKGEI